MWGARFWGVRFWGTAYWGKVGAPLEPAATRIILTPGTARVHALAFAGPRVSAATTATARTVTVTPGDVP